MDPALQQQLAEYLKAIIATAQSGAAFVAEQAPLVVQEKIAYGRALETFYAIAMVAMIGCAATATVRGVRAGIKDEWDGIGPFLASVIGGIGTVVLTCGLLFDRVPVLLQVWFAPRLYILEWAVSLVQSK